MRAPLSIVIPTLDAEEDLAATLMALMEGLSAGLIREVIVSDGGSQDRTLKIADEAGAVVVSGAASRGGQLRRGAEAAKADWVMFLHADTNLAPGWSAAVEAHLPSDKAGYCRLQFADGGWQGRWVARWANLRSALFGLPYGDQALVLSKELYQSTGGYRDMPLMEDVAMARALKGRLVALPIVATTSAARYQHGGWLRRGSRNLWTLARYFMGVSPERLAQSYRK
ncbi:TIGR04283 family arsenosugar biosynthesis glycosyltransferase [Cognatishimia sp. WU-CL00825]|uniref:TIGR04283 family arsenosugar biosynthesis glycosyltransferase n=1 Tax=Cognatishimia sp. WU-CL00825 TaxID=3127658 RepID=UPI00310AB5FD